MRLPTCPGRRLAKVVPGRRQGWAIERAQFTYFERVIQVPGDQSVYTDGDLYLTEINIPDIDSGVGEALRDAATCFRHDLFTPCVAMLGAAVEGAWIELGLSLLPVFASGSSGPKYEGTLRGQGSIKDKVETVKKMWEANPLKVIRDQTGIGTDRLRLVAEWTDEVRRSRNVLHWGVDATTPNGYDKVATMMLTATGHFRTLYGAKRAVDTFVTGAGAA